MKKVITALIISVLVLSFPPQIKRAEAGIITSTIIIGVLGYIAYKIFILCIEIGEFKQALLNELIKHRELKEKILEELQKFINDPQWQRYNEKATELFDLIKSGNYEYKPVDLNIGDLLKNPNFNLDDMLTDLRKKFPDNPIVVTPMPIENPIIDEPNIDNPIVEEPIDTITFNLKSFWKEQSFNSIVTNQFNERNIKDMEKGLAPYAPYEESYGISRGRYEIHFKNGIPSNSLRNIQLVTPREHYNLHKDDKQNSKNGNSINDIISRCKDLSQNWEENYSELVYLFENVHPDFYQFTLNYEIEKINNMITNYEQTTYDPYSDKELLRDIYNDLLNANYNNGSAEYLATILDKSFYLDKSSIYYIYLPEEIDKNRKKPFSFEEFYSFWKQQ